MSGTTWSLAVTKITKPLFPAKCPTYGGKPTRNWYSHGHIRYRPRVGDVGFGNHPLFPEAAAGRRKGSVDHPAGPCRTAGRNPDGRKRTHPRALKRTAGAAPRI